MISSLISRTSAGVLFLGGAVLLFASDTVLPILVVDVQPAATWPGELIGAGWLALAALNWLSRGTMLGGIYGRPIVIANVALYFITAAVLLRVAVERSRPGVLWLIGGATLVLAGVYGWLLLRGPAAGDVSRAAGARAEAGAASPTRTSSTHLS